jgi:hypothetical protein|tara:strand:- start:787 stop:1329 length:543 start_codon:yes stop_codon:yes gene_type:complete
MMNELKTDNYIIVTGGHDEYKYSQDKHILEINCNDYYEGLPEKVIKTNKFIYESGLFNSFTYFCKLDDDIVIRQLINTSMLSEYCGKVNNMTGNRKWHINRCSKDSLFNTTEYSGPYVPWCSGGCGYIISRNSLKILSTDTNYHNEIYEDLYVAKLLYDKQINPTNVSDLSRYIYSKDHS